MLTAGVVIEQPDPDVGTDEFVGVIRAGHSLRDAVDDGDWHARGVELIG